jgi:hypothetical protein
MDARDGMIVVHDEVAVDEDVVELWALTRVTVEVWTLSASAKGAVTTAKSKMITVLSSLIFSSFPFFSSLFPNDTVLPERLAPRETAMRFRCVLLFFSRLYMKLQPGPPNGGKRDHIVRRLIRSMEVIHVRPSRII